MLNATVLIAVALFGQAGSRYGAVGDDYDTGPPAASGQAIPNSGSGFPSERSGTGSGFPPAVESQPASRSATGGNPFGGQAAPPAAGGQSRNGTQSRPKGYGNSGYGDNTSVVPSARPLQSRSAAPGQTRRDAQVAKLRLSELMQQLLERPSQARLSGTPITLARAVRGAKDRHAQTARVEAYWDLSAALADYYLAVREVTELATLQASVGQPGSTWQKARAVMDNRARVAARAAEVAQRYLASEMGGGISQPLPVDLPHTGSYDSRYQQIFAGRASQTAKLLDDLLPRRYSEMKQQAAAVRDARQWLDLVSQRRNKQTDGSGLLKAHELLVLRRRAFVYTVRDYNIKIARYSELAAPGEVADGRLVAMLIRSRGGVQTAQGAGNVRRLSAEEPLTGGSRQTFAQEGVGQADWQGSSGQQDSAYSRAAQQPASPQTGERSIIVRREKLGK